MASLTYLSIPPSATRLAPGPASDIRPAPKISTSLPSPTPSSSPIPARHRSSLSISSLPTSPTNAAFSLLPQMLLSSANFSPAENTTQEGKLLSTRDALSISTTSNNFKRFVARVGPVFWLQDRIEEVVMWRRGWRVTGLWMAVYAFLCYYPRLVFALPHLALIGIILASYPYHPLPVKNVPSDSVNWQANLQAIQNLMGFVADTHDLVEPYTHHLLLSPAHFDTPPSPSLIPKPTHPSSKYPPYILLLLLLSFPPLLFVLASPRFPTRLVCLIAGLAPLVCTAPPVRHLLCDQEFRNAAWTLLERGSASVQNAKQRANRWNARFLGKKLDNEPSQNGEPPAPAPLLTVLERLMDDDRLSDKCWRAEMREVELWENERVYVNPPPAGDIITSTNTNADSDGASSSAAMSAPPPTSPRRSVIRPLASGGEGSQVGHAYGWSKTNLRQGERAGWTRGRDGWGGVREGAVSNLTFSLAPGWAFVPTEGWRKDRAALWAGLDGGASTGSSDDGWIYTNDAWSDARLVPGGGSVTRRRRWVRRIWYDGAGSGGESLEGVGRA